VIEKIEKECEENECRVHNGMKQGGDDLNDTKGSAAGFLRLGLGLVKQFNGMCLRFSHWCTGVEAGIEVCGVSAVCNCEEIMREKDGTMCEKMWKMFVMKERWGCLWRTIVIGWHDVRKNVEDVCGKQLWMSVTCERMWRMSVEDDCDSMVRGAKGRRRCL
jgi:hypothetical protein